MRTNRLVLLAAFLLPSCSAQKSVVVDDVFGIAGKQLSQMLQKNTDSTHIPRTTAPDGTLKTVDVEAWTSGFFAGNLWYLYEYTGDETWLTLARKWTAALEELQHFNKHHDVGFMLYCSFGNGYRLTHDAEYRSVLLNGANALLTRYNDVVKSIKSWNKKVAWDGVTEWEFPVIIDNMMNLELLFWASKESGDKKYFDIAVTHARTTMKNHFRDDFSCYHVVDYDPNTGMPLHKQTSQGFADNSTWARGQAWGLYGFTMCYRETGYEEFLKQAMNIANFIIHNPNVPTDGIPYWDYNVNQPGYTPPWKYDATQYREIPRDASAAAVTASALFELSAYAGKEHVYKQYADKIISTLSSEKYLAKVGENNNFILMHSVGSIPHSAEIDKPLVYADYYFLEALLRKIKLEGNRVQF